MKDKIFIVIFSVIVFMLGLTLFWSQNFMAYNYSYIVCCLFLIIYSLLSPSTVALKVSQIVVYILVVVVQILFNIMVISSYTDNDFVRYVYRAMGVLAIAAPFLIKIKFFKQYIYHYPIIVAEMRSVMSYSQLVTNQFEIADKVNMIKHAGEVLSKLQLQNILYNLPRHSSFNYVNNGVLTSHYFDAAYANLSDENVYIVITRTMSLPSELIGLFTNRPYNHVSIAFDKELKTLVSYNGGQRIAPPGLNPEILEMMINKKGAAVMIYKLEASSEQKKQMIDKIKQINAQGSAYNILGLVLKFSYKPNIMFCSQFVYTLLASCGLDYFKKKPIHVTPMDFVEMDYYRRLEFLQEINFSEEEALKIKELV